MEQLILVDKNDQIIGYDEKLRVHQQGKLHRAFSIYIFNSKGELLIQKRALNKYHSPGIWANTCCSHPRKGEDLEDATHRRLKEEMGFDTELKEAFSLIYKVDFQNGLTENEFLHVFYGEYNGDIKSNKDEVAEWKWAKPEELLKDFMKNPEIYAFWFKKALPKLLSYIQSSSV